MNTQDRLLQFNVGFIAQQSIGYSRDFEFESPSLYLPPDLQVNDFKGRLEVSRTSEGLLFRGEFEGVVEATCGRCLNDFKQPLVSEFTELYTFLSHADEDTELIYPEDGLVDLGPVVREYLLVEFPINPICKPDCQGLCPICGNNRNEEVCDHGSESIDPRLSALKTLLDGE